MLNTTGAEAGFYTVTLRTEVNTAALEEHATFVLSSMAPQYPQDGNSNTDVISVPGGLAADIQRAYLPYVARQ
ncbi:MAG: hypothetical protein HC893_11150 [Chloroflexaceae bacterium]|nr:hypothetical protein [Chloroflexaceae bacterium]